MSGGNCPETPRQKMIGMMYLFLTAMLALNVSGELLKAFELVDRSIQQTTVTIQKKNAMMYADLREDAKENQRAAEPWEKAQQVKSMADSLANHMHSLKMLFVQTADGKEATLETYTKKDNQDIAAQLMITTKDGERSKELKAKIDAYRELVLTLVSPTDSTLRSSIVNTLSTKAPEGVIARSWESEKFEHLPLSASLALMSKLISDVRNVESDVVKHLYSSVDANTYKFTVVRPMIMAKSDVVIRGGKYQAGIMLAAIDDTQEAQIKVNGAAIPVDGGVGEYIVPATSTGKKTYNAEIAVLDPEGNPKIERITGSYEVVDPMVVISPTKMNVFYEGVDNPVQISVPGLTSNQLDISITNGPKPIRKDDVYLVKVNPGTAGGKSKVTVTATIDGNRREVGSMDFRIKRIPPPVAKVGGINEGKMNKNRLLAESGVFAEMDDFDFELEYVVTRFNVSAIKNGYNVDEPSKNNRFTDAQKDLVKGLARGAKVFINDIKAVGPDKRTVSLGSITLTLD
jgi:gliding motility-associated protein GldM